MASKEESRALWESIRHLLSNEREIRLAYLHFHCGLKSKEIVQIYPQEFHDLHVVYSLQRNIFARLAQHNELLERTAI